MTISSTLFPVQANELFSRNGSQNNTSQNEVDDFLTSLAEATNVNATGDSTIFPQDLSTTNLIVKSSVNYLVQNVEIASPMSSLNFSEVRLPYPRENKPILNKRPSPRLLQSSCTRVFSLDYKPTQNKKLSMRSS